MSKSDGNMVFVRDALKRNSPQALRLYLLDIHYRRPFDHAEERLPPAPDRAAALAAALGRRRPGPTERGPASPARPGALEGERPTGVATRPLGPHPRRGS